jgi:hypothetical protein
MIRNLTLYSSGFYGENEAEAVRHVIISSGKKNRRQLIKIFPLCEGYLKGPSGKIRSA